jgi:hypothetical protein
LAKPTEKRNLLKPALPDYDIRYTEDPVLLRDTFPYDEVPRIQFDHKIVPLEPAEDMFITDTTFRDGQQTNGTLSIQRQGQRISGEMSSARISLPGDNRLDKSSQR